MEHVDNLVFIFTYAALAFLVALVLAPAFIRFLIAHKVGKNIREDALSGGPAEIFRALHLKKAGTPTMGGILIWGTTAIIVFFSWAMTHLGWSVGANTEPFAVYDRGETLLPVFTLVTVGLLGAFDDWLNIKGVGAKKGIEAKVKMLWLLVFSGVGAWWFYSKLGIDTIHIPRVGDFQIGLWYVPLFIFVIIATANAVNITDGLDGLAAGLSIIAYVAYGIVAYAHGQVALTTFCLMIAAASTAFLWFNVPPARFFMGDTGALALGATLGVIAMLTNSVVALPLIAGVFVIETFTSLTQLFWKRVFKRKLYPIAPFHHWLEKIGWPEYQVTMRLWILGAGIAGVGVIIALVGAGNLGR